MSMCPDIQSKIRRDFSPSDVYAAIEAIQGWDVEVKGLLDDRRIRCAVYLARGSLDRLRQMIALGMQDWRDLIMAAEYEGEVRVRDFDHPFVRADDHA
jgi:hypothetical protein